MPKRPLSRGIGLLAALAGMGILPLALPPPPAQAQGHSASSCLGRVFGPEVFVRSTGAPVTVVREIPTDLFQPPFVLHLANGDPDGGNRVSSAEVLLDGDLLFSASAFSQQVSGYELPVSLTNPSRLEVRIASQPGSHLRIWIEGSSSLVSPYEPLLVTPEGGRHTTSMGLVLEVPSGAVARPTTIGVCSASELLVTPLLDSYGLVDKYFLGGIELSPAGFQFDLPITLRMPVRLTRWASQVPVLLALDMQTGLYSVAPQDLQYDPKRGIVSMLFAPTNVTSFAAQPELASTTRPTQAQPACKPGRRSWIVVGADSPEIVNINCEDPANKNSCGCGEMRVTSVSEEIVGGGAGNDCYYINELLHVQYLEPSCKGQPEFNLTLGEEEVATPEITVDESNLRRCNTTEAKATVCSAAGRILPASFVRWDVEFGPVTIDRLEGATTKVTAGPNTGMAQLSAKGGCETIQYEQLNVQQIKLEVQIHGARPKMSKGQTETLTATVTEEGRQLGCETIKWRSEPPGVVAVDDTGKVKAENPGTARIWAEPSSAPEDGAFVDINVVGPRYVVMDPPAKWITVNQEVDVSAQVLDEDSQPMSGIPVKWTVDSNHVALVSSQADPPRARVRGDSVGTATVVATVIDFADVKGESIITVTSLTVDRISPSTTANCRTEPVTITGTGFLAGARVGLDGPASVPLVGVRVVSETTITAGTQSQMSPGTYDVVIANPDGQTARLRQAFVVDPCLAYALSWQFTYSCEYEYADNPPNYYRESSQLSNGGSAQVEFGGDGGKTVTTRHLSGTYTVDGGGTAWCATNPDCGMCTSQRKITATVFETTETLGALEGLDAQEAGGVLRLSGLDMVQYVATYRYVERGSGSSPCGIPPTNTNLTWVAGIGASSCGQGYPVDPIALAPLGDGRTYAFSNSETIPQLYGSCEATCSLQGVRISP